MKILNSEIEKEKRIIYIYKKNVKITNTEKMKGKMLKIICKINEKITNTEILKGKMINNIDKKNEKIQNTKTEKKNQIASAKKAKEKSKKNQNAFGKIMSTSNRKQIASHISNKKKIFSKSMKCMQINLVISKEYKIYSMKNVKKSKI